MKWSLSEQRSGAIQVRAAVLAATMFVLTTGHSFAWTDEGFMPGGGASVASCTDYLADLAAAPSAALDSTRGRSLTLG